jgi:hypothetical protein
MRKATEEEVAEVFAHEYNVDVEEVMEYFLWSTPIHGVESPS